MIAIRDSRTAVPVCSHHAVQFYESDAFLEEIVGKFLADGFAAGESAVVIATAARRDAFAERLRAEGLNVAAMPVTFLDARETLATFMVAGLPDAALFALNAGGIIERRGGGGPVRVYGEMVNLLWQDGEIEAAIRLEKLWNDLAEHQSFFLLCAYPMRNFYKEGDGPLLERICRAHNVAVAAESFSLIAGNPDREREIILLQQRATSLEREIAQRQELERALRDALAGQRRAEKDLKDFFEHATLALHRVGPDGTILWANQAELELLGYAADDYIGRNITEFHADAPVIGDILDRLFANEQIRDYEARLKARDGSIKYVSINSNVLFEDGKFIHTRCFTRDITDRKRLEEQNAFLLEATTILNGSLDYESRLRALADLVVPRFADWCAVDIANEDGTCRRVAQSQRTPPDLALELSGQLLADAGPIARVLHSGVPRLIANASEGQDLSTNSEDEMVLQGGSLMMIPMKVGDRVLGVTTMVMMRSGRRYSDRDLPAAVELAHRAAIAIENARLYGVAQEANRAKDEFLATLSHELRTPLTAILGWAQLLTMGGLDPAAARAALETIESSAQTQASLIDDMLDLSRIVTGKFSLRQGLVDIRSAAEGAVQTLELAAKAKGIRLALSAGDELMIVGDSTRLQQIIWNLLSNAVKFSKAGDTVSVSVERIERSARVIVQDSGHGISPDFLPHVFEPFRQADGATTRLYGGLGLGLAIVKYLVELHGGTVAAYSDGPGTGARFTVVLPLAP
jgi:PAS domain S-box-containing protein